MRLLTKGLRSVSFKTLFRLLSASIILSVSDVSGDEASSIFDSDRLLEISIQMPPNDWKTLRTQKKADSVRTNKQGTKSKHYTYFKGDITIDGVTIPSVGIRKKGGFGSVISTRPSLKIKFE